MDFFSPATKVKNGRLQIYPSFRVKKSKDLMIRGKAFYAVWDEEKGLWSRDESDLTRLVDQELYAYQEELKKAGQMAEVLPMSIFESSSWQSYQSYVRSMFDNCKELDPKVVFLHDETSKEDYASHRLPYDLEDGEPDAYNEIMSTIYSDYERRKLEWAIGAVLAGDARRIQKFVVLYGEAGTGKSTFLHIVEQLFQGYWSTFDARSLTQRTDSFATHFFKDNPLVAIQHDGDLSKIEDNATLNSIIAHEDIVVNEKFKAQYTAHANCMLFLGTNSPVKISDAKSGLIRRLIDVNPTGNKLDFDRYLILMDRIPFELGKIANKCLNVYQSMGKKYYNSYRPLNMMYATDAFFNFVNDNMDFFVSNDPVSLANAYAVYTNYIEETNGTFALQRYRFRDELKEYYDIFMNRHEINGKNVVGYFEGFRVSKLLSVETNTDPTEKLVLDKTESIFDREFADAIAQYANSDKIPFDKWENVTKTLKELDTRKLHYVLFPEELQNHIVVDFDLKNKEGQKDRLLNLEVAAKWPPTYAEYSQGGHGIHLHYIYDGDVSKLSRVYARDIEIKVFTGKQSLRRKLTLCNNLPFAHISSGLPLKEEKNLINENRVKDEQHIRNLIAKNLRKEIHPYTKPSVDMIFKILEDAYNSGMSYDVRDMRAKVLTFATKSTHQAEACIILVSRMKFCSEDHTFHNSEGEYEDDRLVFFDVEVFPNLFLVNWKYKGSPKCVHLINPKPSDMEKLFKLKLVGFNCRKYDNHMLYGCYLGYSNEQLYQLSQDIIIRKKGTFKEAYNISYTDIYDFAKKKQSLKKWEIELGIHHMELGIPWDQPVPEDKWVKVSEYCDNDVISAEAVFDACQGDWIAREILCELCNSSGTPATVNDTTNTLVSKFVFGKEQHPQLYYTDLTTGVQYRANNLPVDTSRINGLINYFPSYEHKLNPDTNKMDNWYRDTWLGKGGYVYAEPGIYNHVALLDIQSMHPTSAIVMRAFGEYTDRYKDIYDTRGYIKHGELDQAREMFGGILVKYLEDETKADQLADALKLALNQPYGISYASFDNPFRDKRNVNNIIALRGALFMKTLQDAVVERGFKVCHIKTDSIKIPNATDEIIHFVQEFAKLY